MLHTSKRFVEKLNRCLDETGAPAILRERAAFLSKILDVPRPQARGILEGQQIPDGDLLHLIASEFDVDPRWLAGEK